MAYTVRIGERQFYGVRGNLHMHTTDSDGALSLAQLAHTAGVAGLDYVAVTDHNVYRPNLDAWVGHTLVLVGEEVHNPNREQQSSHILCFNIREDVAPCAADPQAVIDAVNAQGGLAFLAHPFERDAAPFLPEPNISWRDWQVTGYHGIELWNYMSEFKATFKTRPQAVLYAHYPALAIRGPYPETLLKWDELLRARPVAALGGSDAHGGLHRMGPIARVVHPYDLLFACVNTHLLLEAPPSGDLEADRAAVYRALGQGRSFVAYERLGSPAGFSFWARSGPEQATMGETLAVRNAVELRITVPAPAALRLLRDGQVVARASGRALALLTPKPGVYRVEAYRRLAGRARGWIYSNPIYVR